MGYLGNFIVYTFAMVGVIVVALLVFKNSTATSICKKSKYLKIIDSLSIAPRKNLYIISAGEEKFLIAGDVDKTTLISKLNFTQPVLDNKVNTSFEDKISNVDKLFAETSLKDFKAIMSSISQNKQHNFVDKSNIGIHSSMLDSKNQTAYTSVIRNIAEKMRG